ncbi:MAG: diguanylate cyclase [Pseudomonadota bacterium]
MSAGKDTMVPLARVLSRSFTLVGLLGVAVALLAVFTTGFILQRDYARDNLQLLANQAAYSAEVPIIFNDERGLRDALQPILELGDVAHIQITNANGAILATLDGPTLAPSESYLPTMLVPDPAQAPIYSGGSRIGTVVATSSGQGTGRLIIAAIIGAIGCISLIAFGTMAVARRLNHILVAPLGAIAKIAHSVRADGNFERRAPPASIAEVNALADDFNALLSKLHDWQGQISSTHEALLHRASYDLLSGLPNRSAFIERVRDIIRAAQRSDGRFAILFMDGDNFKETNDRFGHAAGDKVIAEVAARLSPLLRAGDVAARLGGDEFAVLVNHLEADEHAGAVANRIGQSMQLPIAVTERDAVTVSMSIGIAIYPDDGDGVDILMQIADGRMYEAKNLGRSQ